MTNGSDNLDKDHGFLIKALGQLIQSIAKGNTMAPPKKPINAVAIDWYAVFVARVCPGLLELIGGGPGGGILEQATAAQKRAILGGVKKIAEQAAKIQAQVR